MLSSHGDKHRSGSLSIEVLTQDGVRDTIRLAVIEPDGRIPEFTFLI
jgi:hypothetical protein